MCETANRPTWTKYLRFLPPVAIALLLFFTFRLYRTAYFWLDDFNNLYWASLTSVADLLAALVNPLSGYFRPAGMVVYWLGWHAFGMSALPYHLIAWAFHAGNTALVYAVLKRLTRSTAGASVGAMLFASQAVFGEIYWSFGTIFELVSGMLMLLGMLLWSAESRRWKKVALATVVFILAFKAKEMAITLPAIWLAYDLIARNTNRWRHVAQNLVPGIIGLCYAVIALGMSQQQMIASDSPYYMDIRSIVLGRSYGFYFNMLFGTAFRWQKWVIGFVILGVLFSFLKNRLAVFFQLYVLITFLPVIFLVNHRGAFYWYIPFFGACGLAAVLVDAATRMVGPYIPRGLREITACLIFIFLCGSTFFMTRDKTEVSRRSQQGIDVEYRNVIVELLALPEPPPDETLYFEAGSLPRFFDFGILERVPKLALNRHDLKVKVVENFPAGAAYRLKFEQGKLIILTP
jgi:hypothetical protein